MFSMTFVVSVKISGVASLLHMGPLFHTSVPNSAEMIPSFFPMAIKSGF